MKQGGQSASQGRRIRLMPVTIGAMGLLFALKSIDLARAAATAWSPAGEATSLTDDARGGRQNPAAAWRERPSAQLGGGRMQVAEAGHGTPPEAAAKPARTPPPQQALQPPAQPAQQEPPTPPDPVTAAERSLMDGARARRAEIEARERLIAEREAVLAAAERRMAQRVDELTTLQRRLESLEKSGRERDENNWTGLVKLYESMRPRDAAEIFNDLDMPVLVQVVHRMKEAKAATVMAAMVPDKARALTSELARLRAAPKAEGG